MMVDGVTIGQAAAFAGVTIKAVRHYHRIGVLPEPRRDTSGYRRYGSQALTRLVQIKTLAEAGVPLADINDLLDAPPDDFTRSLAGLDAALSRHIDLLSLRRRMLRQLGEGDRAMLPASAVALLDEIRALGFDDRFCGVYREGLILARASDPDRFEAFVEHFRARMEDSEHVRLLHLGVGAEAWSPQDPRLESLARAIADNLRTRHRGLRGASHGGRAPFSGCSMVSNHRSDQWPAAARLTRLVEGEMRESAPDLE